MNLKLTIYTLVITLITISTICCLVYSQYSVIIIEKPYYYYEIKDPILVNAYNNFKAALYSNNETKCLTYITKGKEVIQKYIEKLKNETNFYLNISNTLFDILLIITALGILTIVYLFKNQKISESKKEFIVVLIAITITTLFITTEMLYTQATYVNPLKIKQLKSTCLSLNKECNKVKILTCTEIIEKLKQN